MVALGIDLIVVEGNGQGGSQYHERGNPVFWGWFVLIVFVPNTCLEVANLVRRKTSVVLSDAGILYERTFKNEIPWSEISRIEVLPIRKRGWLSKHRNGWFRVHLKSEDIHRYELTWLGMFTRWAQLRFNRHVFHMTSLNLKISGSDFLDLLRCYALVDDQLLQSGADA